MKKAPPETITWMGMQLMREGPDIWIWRGRDPNATLLVERDTSEPPGRRWHAQLDSRGKGHGDNVHDNVYATAWGRSAAAACGAAQRMVSAEVLKRLRRTK